jgi:hypothetical protein
MTTASAKQQIQRGKLRLAKNHTQHFLVEKDQFVHFYSVIIENKFIEITECCDAGGCI